jgi:hypothetical protein
MVNKTCGYCDQPCGSRRCVTQTLEWNAARIVEELAHLSQDQKLKVLHLALEKVSPVWTEPSNSSQLLDKR